MPCFFTAAKDHQEVVRVSRIGAEGGCNFGIAEAEIRMVRISHFILESKRIGQWIFAIGDDSDVFDSVTIKISSNKRRREFCRNSKSIAKLLLYDCRKLRWVGAGRRGCRRGRLAALR